MLASSIYIPILKSLHWLKINQRIQYKILSLTYQVLTTAQPGYLQNLSCVDSPHIEKGKEMHNEMSGQWFLKRKMMMVERR